MDGRRWSRLPPGRCPESGRRSPRRRRSPWTVPSPRSLDLRTACGVPAHVTLAARGDATGRYLGICGEHPPMRRPHNRGVSAGELRLAPSAHPAGGAEPRHAPPHTGALAQPQRVRCNECLSQRRSAQNTQTAHTLELTGRRAWCEALHTHTHTQSHGEPMKHGTHHRVDGLTGRRTVVTRASHRRLARGRWEGWARTSNPEVAHEGRRSRRP